MKQVADRQALDDALAQIDRAFGKDTAEARKADYVKVWTDPFGDDLVLRYIQERVESLLEDEDGGSPFYNDFWYDLGKELECGEHRVIRHPFDRRYPLVTFGERVGLFVRRVLGWFQREG